MHNAIRIVGISINSVVILLFNIFQHGILTLKSELQAVHVWTKRRTKHTTVSDRPLGVGTIFYWLDLQKELVTELNTQHKICQNSWQQ